MKDTTMYHVKPLIDTSMALIFFISTTTRSYSSVCGQVRGHGWGDKFCNAIARNYNSLEQPYLSGVSLSHGPAGRSAFAAAYADGNPDIGHKQYICG